VTQHGPDREPGRAPQVYLIADDLTGAADSAVTFAKYGARVAVSWASSDGIPTEVPGGLDVVAVTTESRHTPRSEAVRRVTAAARSVGTSGLPDWVYKKVDSTLRGHPGAELAAVMTVLEGSHAGISRVLIAPALPSQGRVTRADVHYVDDVPLAQTVFGTEVGTSDVVGLFAVAFPESEVAHLPLTDLRQRGTQAATAASSSTVLVADSETDADLAALIDLADAVDTRLLCGSAGLAEALARHLARDWRRGSDASDLDFIVEGGVLVVAGSRHPRTLDQVEALMADGVATLRPDPLCLETDAAGHHGVADALAEALSGGAAVLTTAGLPDLAISGTTLTSRLAGIVGEALRGRVLGGLVLTGGDTAIAVCWELGATALRLLGEVERGVPWGYLVGGPWAGLPVVTKAGGFGNVRTLASAVRFLESVREVR